MKIERAKRHVRELAEDFQAFSAKDPYTIYTQLDLDEGKRCWKVKIKHCIPEHWSAVVGDAIHNARSALDLLTVAVVRHCDPCRASYNHVHFVIRESKDKFESDLPENIKGASAQARRLIEDLKPYKGGDEALWMLHQLDILDKHKAIIPVGATYHSVGLAMAAPQMAGREPAAPIKLFLKPTARLYPLKDGAELFSAPLGMKLPFKDEPDFRFEIAFGEGQIIDGEPVIPALTKICEFVEAVFTTFEAHILK